MGSKIRDLIKSITKNSDDYNKRNRKIKFNSDDKLPLNKRIEIPSMIIVVVLIFIKITNIISQVFLDECLYKL